MIEEKAEDSEEDEAELLKKIAVAEEEEKKALKRSDFNLWVVVLRNWYIYNQIFFALHSPALVYINKILYNYLLPWNTDQVGICLPLLLEYY